MDHGDKNCEADSKSYEEKWTEIQKLGVLGDEPALVIYTSGTTGNPKVYYFVIKFYPLLLNFDMIIMHMYTGYMHMFTGNLATVWCKGMSFNGFA